MISTLRYQISFRWLNTIKIMNFSLFSFITYQCFQVPDPKFINFNLSDSIQRESAMDCHNTFHLPGVLSDSPFRYYVI